LGKQRIETIQIANILLGFQKKSNAWKNHPVVLMWKGYEEFLIKEYLRNIMMEWLDRGFKNERCFEHYLRLSSIVENEVYLGFSNITKPKWFCDKLFESHKSNLVRKKPEHYKKFWPEISNDIEYWWPTKNGY
jgi:hypothetical protein